jgi:drug/metabolite transporter (DMT)-like permease
MSETIGCGSACILALTIATARGSARPRAMDALQAAIAGAMTLGGPLLALMLAARWVDGSDLTMSLALVPVVVAVARPAFRATDSAELAGRMWPGIVAVTGMLLVLPQPGLADWRADALLVAAPVVTGVGAAWFRSRGGGKAWRSTIGLAAITLLFMAKLAVAGPATWHLNRHVGMAAAFDGALAILGVMSLLRMGATRWSAQFVLVPLAVMAISMAGLLAHLDARMIAGLGLMLLATVFLLLPPRAEDVGEVNLPGLNT